MRDSPDRQARSNPFRYRGGFWGINRNGVKIL